MVVGKAEKRFLRGLIRAVEVGGRCRKCLDPAVSLYSYYRCGRGTPLPGRAAKFLLSLYGSSVREAAPILAVLYVTAGTVTFEKTAGLCAYVWEILKELGTASSEDLAAGVFFACACRRIIRGDSLKSTCSRCFEETKSFLKEARELEALKAFRKLEEGILKLKPGNTRGLARTVFSAVFSLVGGPTVEDVLTTAEEVDRSVVCVAAALAGCLAEGKEEQKERLTGAELRS